MKPAQLAFVVLLLNFVASCDLEDPDKVSDSEIIAVTVDRETLLANGEDTASVMATIPKDAAKRKITFVTSQGRFLTPEGEKKAEVLADKEENGQRWVAKVRLVSDLQPGAVFVSATIGDYTATKEVKFTRVFPTRVEGETSIVTIDIQGSKSAQITAHLFHGDNGKVSLGAEVHFEALQGGQNVGRFSNLGKAASNVDGQAILSFFADTGDVEAGKEVVINLMTRAGEDDLAMSVRDSLSLKVE